MRKKDQIGVHNFYCLRPLKVSVSDTNSKVMKILSLVHFKILLISLVGHWVLFHCTYHHLVAFYVIVHYILKDRHKSFCINQVEIDEVIIGDLDPYIALNEVDEPLDILDAMVELPLELLKAIVPLLLEKQDPGTASHYYSIIKNHLHLSELHISDFLKSKDCKVWWRDGQDLALAVEHIHLIVLRAVKAPLWIVPHVGFELVGVWKVTKPITFDIVKGLSNHLSCLYVPDQVIVS